MEQIPAQKNRPILLFDGDCGFCRRWVVRWREWTKDAVDYAAYQEAAARYPQVSESDAKAAVQLIDADGKVYQGADAVFRTLEYSGEKRWLRRAYQRVPLFRKFSEAAYRVIARNRRLFSTPTRLLWGGHLEISRYSISRWLFLRSLGIIFLVAFVSLWVQVDGLLGSKGISSVQPYLKAVSDQVGASRFSLMPSLLWWNASDAALHDFCAAGVLLSILATLGVIPGFALFGCWAIYLSFVTVGQDFLSFQWDNLLLEAGFLGVLASPFGLWPKRNSARPMSGLILFALWFLLFKLMFSSGCVKLLSGDPTWRNLTALYYHYETQPLPTWIGWWAHQLPNWFQRSSAAGMFVIELALPWLIFFPRRFKMAGAGGIAFLMIVIFLTGNYCFFNLLTLALCFLAVDDDAWQDLRVWTAHRAPNSIGSIFQRSEEIPLSQEIESSGIALWRRRSAGTIAVLITALSFVQLGTMLTNWPVFLRLEQAASPVLAFRTVNHYGLFAVMTTERLEISVEGSNDAREWKPYEFKWKPGSPDARPRFVEPHQPRLDWQMWFAALGNYQSNPWFIRFLVRLLQGSPEVIDLLASNPFPSAPPRYIRAMMYQYHFSDMAARRSSGAWWTREAKGLYCPVVGLK